MQISSQIDEPDYGTLLDSMLYTAKAGEVLEIPVKHFIAPRVEVELAFVLKAPLAGPNVTVEDVLAATDYITPAIEIIDARIEQFDRHTKVMRKVYDTISDNAANAGIVLGAGDPRYQADPLTTDLPWCGAVLKQNGVVEETGLAAGVQGHPAVGIAWLAHKLAPWGESLRAGQIVLAGSVHRPAAADAVAESGPAVAGRPGASRRDPALQVWPELPIMPVVAPVTLSVSAASSSTMKALLPPSSRPTRLTVVAASFWICTPTGSEPVKLIISTSSWVESAVPITLPCPWIMLNTPAGTPAASMISARICAEKGASCGGLRIMVQPVASAGKTLTQVWFIGQFHGVMRAQTPMGSRRIRVGPRNSSNAKFSSNSIAVWR